MLLERTISQLDIGPVPPDQAAEMAQLGYMQWLGSLPGQADYIREAHIAYGVARPFADHSPAIDAFCTLLMRSVELPPRPLPLRLPVPARRGGAMGRRMLL